MQIGTEAGIREVLDTLARNDDGNWTVFRGDSNRVLDILSDTDLFAVHFQKLAECRTPLDFSSFGSYFRITDAGRRWLTTRASPRTATTETVGRG